MDARLGWTTLFAIFLLASILPVGVQAAQNAAPEVTEFQVTPSSVDLVANKGTQIQFVLKVHPGTQPDGDNDEQALSDEVRTVQVLFLREGSQVLSVSLQRTDPASWDRRSWHGTLDVDDPRLVVGHYRVVAVAYDEFGAAGNSDASGLSKDVSASSSSQPGFTLSVEGVSPRADGSFATKEIGAASNVQARVVISGEPQLLGEVSYALLRSGGIDEGPFTVPAPYVVPADVLPEGTSVMHIEAHDRLGRQRVLDLPIFVDTEAPVVVTEFPNLTLRHVPFTFRVAVDDAIRHDVRVVLDNVTHTSSSTIGTAIHSFDLMRESLGNATAVVEVVDGFGNPTTRTVAVNTTTLDTDTRVRSVRLADPNPLVGDPVRVIAVIAQSSELAPVSANVTFLPSQGEGNTTNISIPAGGSAELSHDLVLPQGRYSIFVEVIPDPLVNETDASDQNRTLEFDVFLGRVLWDGKQYHIRADSVGLPQEAVGPDGTTYALGLRDKDTYQVFTFQVGDDELHWDPTQRITDLGSPSDDDDGDKESPGPALILLMLALVGLAWSRRR